MIETLSSLLLYPFENGQLSYPGNTSKLLFWNASYLSGIDNFQNMDVVQSFKPYADSWKAQGITVQKDVPVKRLYKDVFCLLPKQKEAALYMMAQSFAQLEEGGLLLCVAANDAGGKNIGNWMKEFGATPTSLSKSKCRIVWTYKKDILQNKIDFYCQKGARQKVSVGGQNFVTQPGIFGWNKIDKGSQLLLQNMPDDLRGTGADFGCCYGFLSIGLLDKYKNIQKLYALEADYNALSCAQENLTCYEGDVDIHYGWVDLTKNQNDAQNLDWIVTNPPFHDGKKMDNEVGKDFIKRAFLSLKKSGTLYMVANSHLPYEKVLEKSFLNVTKICEENGYKVFIAHK